VFHLRERGATPGVEVAWQLAKGGVVAHVFSTPRSFVLKRDGAIFVFRGELSYLSRMQIDAKNSISILRILQRCHTNTNKSGCTSDATRVLY